MNDDEIARMYARVRTMAIVGASSKPERDSNEVARYLMDAGYDVVPVNPNEREILGVSCHPSLADVPRPMDVVVVFRRSEETPEVARAAAAIGATVLWLQLGVKNAQTRAIAEAAGLAYVEDRCIMATHRLMRRYGILDGRDGTRG